MMTGVEAVAALPNMIRVSGFDIAIVKTDPMFTAAENKWGSWSCNEQMIRIQEHMPSRFKAVDTFLHELLHTIYWVHDIRDDDKEERVVGIISVALLSVHRDNPWLGVWLSRALHP